MSYEKKEEGYTAEEINEIIESGDLEFINDLSIPGKIKQIRENQEELSNEPVLEDPSAIAPEPVQTPAPAHVAPVEQPVAQGPVPDSDGKTLFEESVSALEESFQTKEKDLNTKVKTQEEQINEWKEKYRILEEKKAEPTPAPVAPVAKPLSLNETEEDLELASNYAKNNRTQISEITAKLDGATSVEEINELRQVVNNLREDANKRAKKDEIRDAQEELDKKEKDKQEYLINLFGQINAFSAGKEHLQLSKDISERYTEHNELRERLGSYLHTEKPELINKALYGMAFNESEFYTNMKGDLAKIGVQVPEDTGNYLKLSEIVDLKNGTEYDPATGKTKDIIDSRGRVICQRNIEDAYKLSNYPETIATARKEQTESIQQALSNKANAAVTLPIDASNDGGATTVMTAELANQIFEMDDHELATNPEFMAQYKEALKFIGQ